MKGEIPWESGIEVRCKSAKSFHLHTPNRIYYIGSLFSPYLYSFIPNNLFYGSTMKSKLVLLRFAPTYFHLDPPGFNPTSNNSLLLEAADKNAMDWCTKIADVKDLVANRDK